MSASKLKPRDELQSTSCREARISNSYPTRQLRPSLSLVERDMVRLLPACRCFDHEQNASPNNRMMVNADCELSPTNKNALKRHLRLNGRGLNDSLRPHMSDEESRRIRFNGRELGEYSIARLNCERLSGKVDQTAEFFSPRRQQWFRLVEILEDLCPTEQILKEMQSAGVEEVRLISSEKKGECSSCKHLENRIYSIDNVPSIPPADCSCIPWCSLVPFAHHFKHSIT